MQVTRSPATKPLLKVAPVPRLVPLSLVHSTVELSESPSSSLKLQLQLRVSRSVGLLGLTLTLVTTGALLPMVTLALSGVPEPSSSVGVTVQVTWSPLTKAPERLAAVPTTFPPILHSTVDSSASPSASKKL